jgi:hypothetical protein
MTLIDQSGGELVGKGSHFRIRRFTIRKIKINADGSKPPALLNPSG